MKDLLVIHPRFSLYGGGELLCLHVIKALLEQGHRITLASDSFSPAMCEQMFGPIGRVLSKTRILLLPRFKQVLPRFLAYQHLRYAGELQKMFGKPELVVSTQSSLYYVPGVETYHFIYDMVDLSVVRFTHSLPSTWWKGPYYLLLRKYRSLLEKPEPTRHFLALSRNISRDLNRLGYENRMIIPPCPVDYGPLPKKNQVVKVTRVVPIKRLEEFAEIARRLPAYEFHLVGLTEDRFLPYRDRLLQGAPRNLVFHEKPFRAIPHVLQESKVYLYTSHEPGLPIAVVQGIGAGCFPIVPDTGGGPEAVDIAGLGGKYRTVNEAVEAIDMVMRWNSGGEHVAMAARKFSPERFRERVQAIIR